jgi:hypothetical protein
MPGGWKPPAEFSAWDIRMTEAVRALVGLIPPEEWEVRPGWQGVRLDLDLELVTGVVQSWVIRIERREVSDAAAR